MTAASGLLVVAVAINRVKTQMSALSSKVQGMLSDFAAVGKGALNVVQENVSSGLQQASPGSLLSNAGLGGAPGGGGGGGGGGKGGPVSQSGTPTSGRTPGAALSTSGVLLANKGGSDGSVDTSGPDSKGSQAAAGLKKSESRFAPGAAAARAEAAEAGRKLGPSASSIKAAAQGQGLPAGLQAATSGIAGALPAQAPAFISQASTMALSIVQGAGPAGQAAIMQVR
jgi:hypothetical protein